MAEKKFGAQVNYGWGLTLNMTGKAPAVAKRIFDTYADALAYANDVNDSAIEGLVLSVVADTDATKNGAYFVQQAASKAVEADGENEAVDAKEAILVKLGSADAAAGDTADALNEAKAYTDAEVKKLADGAVKTNTDAIATLNGDAETDGSVAKAVATEKARAEAAEKVNADAISAETKARQDAIAALDAEVTSSDGTHVTVKVTEVDGVITAVNVTESDIASASATTDAIADETAARKEAVSGLAADIADEIARATQAEGTLAGRVTATENAITKLNGDAETDGSVAKAVADAKKELLGDASEGYQTFGELEDKIIAAEAAAKAAATKIADKTSGHVTVSVEEDPTTKALTYTISESDIASASALTQEITDRENAIAGLNATVGTQTVAEGKHVAVEVVETAGKLTSLVVVEDDIASATVLAEVKEDVDNFFKDASFAESAKDTLKELQDYINADAEGAATMTQAIADNKKAIEDEVARAEAAESGLTDAIAAEKARAEAAESGLTDAIADETAARKAADQAINDTIGEVESGKTLVEMIKAAEAAAIAAATVVAEDSEFITIEQTGEVGKTQTYTIKTQDVASASATTASINAEKARAEAAEKVNADAISAETSARQAAIAALDAEVTSSGGTHVTVKVTEVDGVITAVNVTESDIASATATTKAIADETTAREEAVSGLNKAISDEVTRATGVESGLETRLAAVEADYVKSVEAVEGSMIKVSESEQKVTLSLQWGEF